MKEATKLLIESGIIPESVVNLCRIWGGESTDLSEVAAVNMVQTQEELLVVVRKVAELLEKDALPELKESEPDLDVLYKKTKIKARQRFISRGGMSAEASAFVGFTAAGKMIVKVTSQGTLRSAEEFAVPGSIVYLTDGRTFKITHVEPRYRDDQINFYVCDVEPFDA